VVVRNHFDPQYYGTAQEYAENDERREREKERSILDVPKRLARAPCKPLSLSAFCRLGPSDLNLLTAECSRHVTRHLQCSFWCSFLGNHDKIAISGNAADAGPEDFAFFSLFGAQNLNVTVTGTQIVQFRCQRTPSPEHSVVILLARPIETRP
jgi:hypothetical protein